jgi:hypothetical protein
MVNIDDDMLLPLLNGDSASGGAGTKMAARTLKSANLLKLLYFVRATATTLSRTKLRWASSGKNHVMRQLNEFESHLEKL